MSVQNPPGEEPEGARPPVVDPEGVAETSSDETPPVAEGHSVADQDQAADPVRAAGGAMGDEVHLADALDRSRVRRAPRYRGFAVAGGLLGLILAAVFTPFAAETEYLDHGGLFVLLTALLVPVGILMACIVAALLDRRSR
ncbi:hypothetical protein [Ruania halotolerans]|uniref:hypothetical protein n=1 Tax=Ruania halotolerans TaxID=2897773 RepID=UPI001E5B92C9|nr:hypothetical protein [Ruania halotolerans]UFU05992.1 hypothetical protein LQF10_16440 [Ruania halotolerans]